MAVINSSFFLNDISIPYSGLMECLESEGEVFIHTNTLSELPKEGDTFFLRKKFYVINEVSSAPKGCGSAYTRIHVQLRDKPKLRFIIIGQGRHGKDTAAEILNEHFGLNFKSSSLAAAEIFIYDKLKEQFNYKSFSECYEDRHNRRGLWHHLITEYNTPDKSKLASEIFKNNDIYVGMRCPEELKACVDKFKDVKIIYVDAYERLGDTETSASNRITKNMADYVVDNNGSRYNLEVNIVGLVASLYDWEYNSMLKSLSKNN